MFEDRDECRDTDGSGARDVKPAKVIKCIMCGFRSYPALSPAMQLTQAQLKEIDVNKRGGTMIQETMDLVKKFKADIEWLRSGKKPAGWDAVAGLIRQATGRNIKGQTVEKYYNLIRSEQCQQTG